jgi:hypothetical protein
VLQLGVPLPSQREFITKGTVRHDKKGKVGISREEGNITFSRSSLAQYLIGAAARALAEQSCSSYLRLGYALPCCMQACSVQAVTSAQGPCTCPLTDVVAAFCWLQTRRVNGTPARSPSILTARVQVCHGKLQPQRLHCAKSIQPSRSETSSALENNLLLQPNSCSCCRLLQ